jgi:polysaccharide biosynthesis transport protein
VVKLADLVHEARAEREVYEQLLTRERELSETRNLEPSDLRIVSPAAPPTRHTMGRLPLAIGAAVLGLLAGLAYALLREARNTALKTPDAAARLAGFQVRALAPFREPSPDAETRASSPPDLRPWLAGLCVALTEPASGQGRVMLVASPQGGEGRSTIAANVAAWCADSGLRVLLIKADRAGSARRSRQFGLIDVLERGEGLRDAFVERPNLRYTVLPFGGGALERRVSAAALMNGVTLRATLKLCRRWFDIIVIDGPPALGCAHVPLLAHEADFTAMVVEWNKTTPAAMTQALQILGSKEVAIVFNKVDLARFALFDPDVARRLRQQGAEIARRG